MPSTHPWRLIDGLVVLAMAAVALSLAVPACSPGTETARKAANKVKAQTQFRAILQAFYTHAAAHGDKFPAGPAGQRFHALVAAPSDALPPAILIAEGDAAKKPWPGSGAMTTDHFSFALLDGQSPDWRPRRHAQVPLVADRLEGAGSLWNPQAWEGSVGWADLHVSYEKSRKMATVSTMPDPMSPAGLEVAQPQDDIFSINDGGANMVYD